MSSDEEWEEWEDVPPEHMARFEAIEAKPFKNRSGIEVSTAGRVKSNGKILKPQRNGKRMRVRLHGRYYDTSKLLAKVTMGVYTEARPLTLELWLPVQSALL